MPWQCATVYIMSMRQGCNLPCTSTKHQPMQTKHDALGNKASHVPGCMASGLILSKTARPRYRRTRLAGVAGYIPSATREAKATIWVKNLHVQVMDTVSLSLARRPCTNPTTARGNSPYPAMLNAMCAYTPNASTSVAAASVVYVLSKCFCTRPSLNKWCGEDH